MLYPAELPGPLSAQGSRSGEKFNLTKSSTIQCCIDPIHGT